METKENVLVSAAEPKKPSKISRLKAYLFNRKAEKEFRKENKGLLKASVNAESAERSDKTEKETRRIGEYLNAIENQLDKVDEQNKILLFHLSTVRENNEALLNQISVLSKNNEQLFEQFQSSKKREKLAKIIAIIASSLAIGFWVYKFVLMFLGK